MTQWDRDRLVVLKKAQKKLITQEQAATELDLTERQVRRLLERLKSDGDKAVIHGLRGKGSNRKLSQATREQIVRILSRPEWQGFGPTLAGYRLSIQRGGLTVWHETVKLIPANFALTGALAVNPVPESVTVVSATRLPGWTAPGMRLPARCAPPRTPTFTRAARSICPISSIAASRASSSMRSRAIPCSPT
ncbi:MAG: helix-turn-helix domain-containing protein [Acidobacteria bacterium]|nr:helix-turn-helix domain-containing protein [Acidobacteriota bacterium]